MKPKKFVEVLPKSSELQKVQSQPQVSITLYAGEEKSTKDTLPTKMNIQPMTGNVHVTVSPIKPGRSVPMISLDSAIKEISTPDICTPPKEQSQQSLSTPRSGQSHVRALDFSTPPKHKMSVRKANTSPKLLKLSSLKKSSSKKIMKKNLFKPRPPIKKYSPINLGVPIATRTPSAKLSGEWDNIQGTGLILRSSVNKNPSPQSKKKKSWDEDLRALCAANSADNAEENKTAAKKRNRNSNKSKQKISNKTTAESNDIEKTPASTEKNIKSKKAIKSTKKSVKKKVEDNDEEDTGTKNLANDTREQNQPKTKSTKKKVKKSPRKNIKTVEKEEAKEDSVVELEQTKAVLDENVTNTEIIKDSSAEKNNVENSTIKNVSTDETQTELPLTKIEQKTDKDCERNKNSVTSSSHVVSNNIEQKKIENSEITTEIQVTDSDKITPLTSKINEEIPITFKTNLTSLFETPMKTDISMYPMTPNIFTPLNQDTPFTKILSENLGSVDIATIPTPNFPITPNFSNLTPGSQVADEAYNRPTDYSTSSSYYQPSDCEHAQVLDTILIEESKKLEQRILNSKEKMEGTHVNSDNKKTQECSVLERFSLSPNKKPGSSKAANIKLLEFVEVNISTSVIEKTIHPSNINQDQLDSSTCSHSSSSSSTSGSSYTCNDSSCSYSSDEADSEENNKTVIQIKEVETESKPTKGYMLRSRKTPFKVNDESNVQKTTPIKISVSKKQITKVQPKSGELKKSNVLDKSTESATPEDVHNHNKQQSYEKSTFNEDKNKSFEVFKSENEVLEGHENDDNKRERIIKNSPQKNVMASTKSKSKRKSKNDEKVINDINVTESFGGESSKESKSVNKSEENFESKEMKRDVAHSSFERKESAVLEDDVNTIKEGQGTEDISKDNKNTFEHVSFENKTSLTCSKNQLKITDTNQDLQKGKSNLLNINFQKGRKFISPKSPQLKTATGARIARRHTTMSSAVLETLQTKRLRVVNMMKNEPKSAPLKKKVQPKQTNVASKSKTALKSPRKKVNRKSPMKKAKAVTLKQPQKSDNVLKNKRNSSELTSKKEIELTVDVHENSSIYDTTQKLQLEKNKDEKVAVKDFLTNVNEESNKILSITTGKRCENLNECLNFFPYEEIPRLHLTSDEEDAESGSDLERKEAENKKLEDLKERGIHLIPTPCKFNKNIDKNVATSTPVNDKIHIQNIKILDKSNLINVDKNKTEEILKTDLIPKSIKDTYKNTNTNKNIELNIHTTNIDASQLKDLEEFDSVLITEDSAVFHKFTYNAVNACNRNFDYNTSEIMKKTVNAQVFSDEFNIELKRIMKITDYCETLSIPSTDSTDLDDNKKKVVRSSKKEKILSKLEESAVSTNKDETNLCDTKEKTQIRNSINLGEDKTNRDRQNEETLVPEIGQCSKEFVRPLDNEEEDELFEVALLGKTRSEQKKEFK